MNRLCGTATKRPVEVQWFRWKGNSVTHLEELSAWINSFGSSHIDVLEFDEDKIKIKTLEGSSYNLPDGYIIIRGVKGEFYPCEPKIFLDTYEIEGLGEDERPWL